jgi:hypothetical protein
LGRLVDQSDRFAVDVLELHVEGVRMVPEAQHRLQGGCRLTIVLQVNFAYRWFCGLSIEDKIPDHSAWPTET